MAVPADMTTTTAARDGTSLRIAMTSYYLPSESKIGAGYVAHRFAEAMVGRGHDVTMFSPCRRPDGATYRHVHVPITGHLRTFRWPFSIRALDLSGYDVLHTHGDDHLRVGRPTPAHVRTMHGSCLSEALHIHGAKDRLRMFLLGLTEVAATFVADRTVLISDNTRTWFPWVRTVIPNGVDLDLFHPGGKAADPTILFVGTYEQRKRGRLLAEAFARDVRPALPQARLEMVCSDAPAAPGVDVLGRLTDDELAEHYRRAWVFCLPSTYEGFGVPYIEAMASGTAVVATANPGAVEVLAGGRFGDIVADDQLGSTLKDLLRDEPRRVALAASALERSADYSWDRVCGQYEAIYAELRARGAGSAPAPSVVGVGPGLRSVDPIGPSGAEPGGAEVVAGAPGDPVLPVIANVTAPFSEYSSASGNARATKIYQYSRAYEERGGRSYVVASARRRHDYGAGRLVLVDSARNPSREYLTETERRLDGLSAIASGRRPFIDRLHRPLLSAVPPDAEVVVFYNYAGAITSSFRARFDGQIVLELGNWVFESWTRRATRALFDRVDLVICVSEFLAGKVAAKLGHWPDSLRVVRNGVDLDAFHPAASDDATQGEILFVGNMQPHKGAHHLVAAAHILRRRGVDFHVRIVGSAGLRSTPMLSDYEGRLRIEARGLEDHLEFVPFVNRLELPAVYRQSSIFCMPVEWDEPAGQVVTEAMASGLAVVSARRGGIPEYLGPDGTYVDPTDHVALADRLEELVRDPDERRRRGRALRAAAEQMSWESRVDEFLAYVGSVRATDVVAAIPRRATDR